MSHSLIAPETARNVPQYSRIYIARWPLTGSSVDTISIQPLYLAVHKSIGIIKANRRGSARTRWKMPLWRCYASLATESNHRLGLHKKNSLNYIVTYDPR